MADFFSEKSSIYIKWDQLNYSFLLWFKKNFESKYAVLIKDYKIFEYFHKTIMFSATRPIEKLTSNQFFTCFKTKCTFFMQMINCTAFCNQRSRYVIIFLNANHNRKVRFENAFSILLKYYLNIMCFITFCNARF